MKKWDDNVELKTLERVIRRGQKAFFETCSAIREIEIRGLYVEYAPTITDYLRERWDFTKSDTSRYRSAGRVLEQLAEFDKLPTNESQCRALSSIDEKQMKPVWQTIIDSGEKPTASIITETANRMFPKQEPEPTEEPPAAETVPASVQYIMAAIQNLHYVDVSELEPEFINEQLPVLEEAVARLREAVSQIVA